MNNFNRSIINFQQEDTKYKLWRLHDEGYHYLRGYSIPIKDNHLFWILGFWAKDYESNEFNISQAFIALELIFGASSNFIDDWKGTFSFPLLMLANNQSESTYYLLKIYDHRGSLSFSFYRLIMGEIDEQETMFMKEPEEVGFSQEKMKKIMVYLYGYLQGIYQVANKSIIEPFLKKIPSELILYGYEDGEFFEKEFSSESEYQEAIVEFETKYQEQIQSQKLKKLQQSLENIMGKS